MTRQYQGVQQVAPRGASMGYITIGDPQARTTSSSAAAQVTLPTPPPPDKRLGLSVRDEVRELQRGKADAGQTLPVQIGVPPGVMTEQQAEGFMGNLGATNQVVMDLDQRVVRLEKALDTALELVGTIDPTKLKTEVGQDLYAKTSTAIEQAKQAAEAAKKAAEGAPAEIDKAIEKATPGILEKAKKFLPEGLVAKAEAAYKVASGLKAWVFGSYAGLGLLAIAFIWIFKDVRDYIKTKGEDKLTIQVLADKLDGLAERTRNPVDDYAAGGLQTVANTLASLVERLSGIEPAPIAKPAPRARKK